MDFDYSPRQKELTRRIGDFMDEHIFPAVPIYEQQANDGDRWKVIPILEELKSKARAAGLWNMFMPPSSGHPQVDDTFQFEGVQLTNLEYAPIAEMFGRVGFAGEVFNCHAPDVPNMVLLQNAASPEQKQRWLRPLLEGKARSAFAMTEPAVASSDATNIATRIERRGSRYVVNGRKWWSSDAGDPRCKVAVVMGKTVSLERPAPPAAVAILVPHGTLLG